MLGRGGLGAAHGDLLPIESCRVATCYLPLCVDFPSFVFFVHRVFFVFILPSAQIRENRDQPTSAGRCARGSDDVRRVRILLDGKEGSTGVQMARIVARAFG